MKNTYKLVGRIKEVKGICYAGHKVGEKFDLSMIDHEGKHPRTPPLCPFFYGVVYPYALALQFGARFPWDEDVDKTVIGCPDNCKVSIEIKRVRRKPCG